ncbi:DNA polymerase III subunit delta [Kingella kingae]|uniref:DNA polymerase III subunit delta n=2 Tax=Kingella kingae TaxID=504 RepID=UPI00041CE784|nr:DNA polymerase III subunit delta [Kingella kingae]MDK4575711.1 DNA polymerase III subunit delta [Kingella kingae]MDK4581695.1 DNA polymerase III subunit delta [Kingella kingae]MDK4591951.1 DNA polymerase III subunit delta [Kingella kingae]MDK4593776.1 DNA polymerase III subunit delta [Kingella kingae]MDK4643534.1 DNA polymerase III subunit delta [Kingella kingae]
MAELSWKMLESSLQRPLSPLYLIHGEEELLRLEAVDATRAAAKQQQYLNREVYTVDSANFDWQPLLAEANSVSLFASQKLLEIHIPNGKVGKQGGDALQQLAQQLPADTVMLLVLPKLDKTQTQSKWFTALAKNGMVLEAKPIVGNALPAWIRERLAAQGLDIDADALQLFTERVEGNLLAAKQEIEKLGLLYAQGHVLSLDDVQAAIANVARFDVFDLSSAWLGGDTKRVVRLLEGLEAEGDEPVLALWSVAEDIRTVIRLSAALKQGKTAQQVRNELRLWGDKQTLMPKAAARLSVAQLINSLQECAKIDRQIKGAESGDAWASFRHLVMTLAH